ncbi:hypothetical protein JOF53_001573 [Crossiella equi]|uniref:VanZ-like domain-containing protein n=1 Tax=Crossiella equi TaxID=130796 RepID=A0ABS5A8R5_9PSEU|nr:hypothetical protein [Crossiella equi]MBP2472701.1 hypothetical protein [Crossiella equi]
MPGVIAAFLRDQPAALPVFAVLVLVAGLVGWLVGRGGRGRGWAVVLLGVSGALVVATALTPSRGGGGAFGVCRVAVPGPEPVLTTSGVLGLALFVPVCLVAVLVFRRVWLTLAAGAVAAVAVEVGHALVPALGKACDTDHLLVHLLGVLVGTVLGGVATGFRRAAPPRFPRLPWLVAGAVAVVCTALTAVLVRPAVDTPVPEPVTASREQDDLLRDTARRFLGPEAGHQLREVRPVEDKTLLIATLTSGGTSRGTVYLDWPAGEVTAAEFTPPLAPSPNPVDATAARDIATLLARTHFPWALAAELRVQPTPSGDFSASWRQHRDGILLPLRADLLLDKQGALVQFSTAKIPAPPLCAVTITQSQAETTATTARPGRQVARGELVARQVNNQWTPVWSLGLVPLNGSPEQVFIHACDGRVLQDTEVR